MANELLELRQIAAQLMSIHKSALKYAQSVRSTYSPVQPSAYEALRSIRDNAQRAVRMGWVVDGEPDLLPWIIQRAEKELAIAETQEVTA